MVLFTDYGNHEEVLATHLLPARDTVYPGLPAARDTVYPSLPAARDTVYPSLPAAIPPPFNH